MMWIICCSIYLKFSRSGNHPAARFKYLEMSNLFIWLLTYGKGRTRQSVVFNSSGLPSYEICILSIPTTLYSWFPQLAFLVQCYLIPDRCVPNQKFLHLTERHEPIEPGQGRRRSRPDIPLLPLLEAVGFPWCPSGSGHIDQGWVV